MTNKAVSIQDLYNKINDVCSTIDGIIYGLSTTTTCDSVSVVELFRIINDELKTIIDKNTNKSSDSEEILCDKCNLVCEPYNRDKNGKILDYQCPICKQVYQN